jgi:hypothetical protein
VVYKFNVSDLEKFFSREHWYIHGLRDREVESTFAAKLGFISVDTSTLGTIDESRRTWYTALKLERGVL